MFVRQNKIMSVNGLTTVFNMPEAVERKFDRSGNERVASLPPYAQQVVYSVDEFPACPDSWMHGSATESSYFVPVKEGKGMWLDFSQNRGHPTHEVAIVPSIQGINPITGLPSDPIRLEQYKDKCPKHDVKFKQDRYCDTCGYKWPAQNYLTTTNKKNSHLWIDGFRAEDGVVRQYYLTEEDCKSVAGQVMGHDKKVYAIGIAFYLSKNPKPVPPRRRASVTRSWGMTPKGYASMHCNEQPESVFMAACSLEPEEKTSGGIDIESRQKKLEIGAGAKINQKIDQDPNNLDYWQEEPAGFIYINYCDQATADRIIKAGKRKEKTEGFLAGLELKD